MAQITSVVGGLLIALGLAAYFGTGTKSITAMIPAFFGIPVLLSGLLAFNEKFKMHAMHVAVVVTLLGFLGGLRGVPGLLKLLGGGAVKKPNAVYVQVGLSLICLVHVVLAVRSFIQARKARESEASSA